MVDLYARHLVAVSKRSLLRKVNALADDGYILTGNIERKTFAWLKWRATMSIRRLPDTETTRAIDEFIKDPSTGVRRVRPAA